MFVVVYSTNTCAVQRERARRGQARARLRRRSFAGHYPAACHSGYSKIVVFTLALHNGVFTTYSSKSLELNLPGIDYAAALLPLFTLLYISRCFGCCLLS